MNLEINKSHVRESQVAVTTIQDHFISPDGLKSHHVDAAKHFRSQDVSKVRDTAV